MSTCIISLTNVGKRFNREWIFRHFDFEFTLNKRYAIVGPNGSGKSTLLQVIGGALSYSEGKIEYNKDAEYPLLNTRHLIPASSIYQHISIATPYLELIEEMTAKEMLEFHKQFKSLSLPVIEILKVVGLENSINKQLRYFSSGMKQRLKLAQAFFSQTPVLLLDEPTTNLDADGISLYHQLITNYTKEKLVIISSNDKQEYSFCEELIKINKYKI